MRQCGHASSTTTITNATSAARMIARCGSGPSAATNGGTAMSGGGLPT